MPDAVTQIFTTTIARIILVTGALKQEMMFETILIHIMLKIQTQIFTSFFRIYGPDVVQLQYLWCLNCVANGLLTLNGDGTRTGTGTGSNGPQYIVQKCSHWGKELEYTVSCCADPVPCTCPGEMISFAPPPLTSTPQGGCTKSEFSVFNHPRGILGLN